MPSVLAVIELSFDPMLHIGPLTLRWQAIGVTLALLAAFWLAARIATPSRGLRLRDMLLIVAGIVPGAVIGGRLVHAVSFVDAYAAAPLSVLDPSVGSLSLLGAVFGGLVTGAYIARLIEAPVARWADAAAVPLLVAIGIGKTAQLLGGSGQGVPIDGPWAIAFTGPGPWVAASPAIPSHPAQLQEAAWALLGAIAIAVWAYRRYPEGQLFVVTLAWFLVGRVVIGFTWRDDAVVGPLNAEQLLALVGLGAALALLRPAARRRLGVALGLHAPVTDARG